MSRPTPFPLGRAHTHIQQSRGADNYLMNFYVTSYSTSFTKAEPEARKMGKFQDLPAYSGSEAFKPRSAPPDPKTGFISNVRPQIYYRRTLDELDNPEMGQVLAENYNTITHLHYQPYRTNDGLEELPTRVVGQQTAFTQAAVSQVQYPRKVYNVLDNCEITTPFDVLQKSKCKLDRLNDHNPISLENNSRGPKHMSTEYGVRFENPTLKKEEKISQSVGPQEISGFQSNTEKDDILTDGKAWQFERFTTGISDYQKQFRPYEFRRSETQLPNLSNLKSTKDSNFAKSFNTSGVYSKFRAGNLEHSEYKDHYLGKQSVDALPSEKLGTADTGPKELAGQSKNERGFASINDNSKKTTNYQISHFNMVPKGIDRQGYIAGGVLGAFNDGYSKSNRVQNADFLIQQPDLTTLDSYQSRSIRANT